MHDCYERLSEASMRAEVEFSGATQIVPESWRKRLCAAVDGGAHPSMMAAAGVTVSLLAYCGFTLQELLMRNITRGAGVVSVTLQDVVRYPLDHLISAFNMKFCDLMLLGFQLPHLTQRDIYPLIVLYDRCEFRADTLFGFDISYTDLRRFVLDVDPSYASLLNLNLKWWQTALAPPPSL